MGELHYDTGKIMQAAKAMGDKPLSHMMSAEKYVSNDTALSLTALGIVGIPAMTQYQSAQSEMVGNLKGGQETIKKIATSLGTVAQNYGEADAKSTIQKGLANGPKDGVPYKKPKGDGFSYTQTEGAAMLLGGAGLAAMSPFFTATTAALMSSIALAPISAFALGIWLLFSPDDGSVDHAHAGWQQVETQLTATKSEITEVLSSFLGEGAWDSTEGDSSRYQFNTFMTKTLLGDESELVETKNRANKTYTSLESMKNGVNTVQATFFAYILVIFTTLVSAWVASFCGPLAPAAEAVKKFCAALLGIGATTAVAGIALLAGGLMGNVFGLWIGAEDAFPKNKPNADGQTSFNDVNRMDWNWDAGQVRQPG